MHLVNSFSWWVVDNIGICSYLSHTYTLTLIEDSPPFVHICLVVNHIVYHLLACSTSFLEAFIFGLSLIVNSFHFHIVILFSYCEILSCPLFASSSLLPRFLFSKLFALQVILATSRVGFSTPTWYQSLPVASCSKDFWNHDLKAQTLVWLCNFSSIWDRAFFWSNLRPNRHCHWIRKAVYSQDSYKKFHFFSQAIFGKNF